MLLLQPGQNLELYVRAWVCVGTSRNLFDVPKKLYSYKNISYYNSIQYSYNTSNRNKGKEM